MSRTGRPPGALGSKAKERLPQTFPVGAGGPEAGGEEGAGPGGVAQVAARFSGSGEGAAAAEGGAAALRSPCLRGEVPAPRPRARRGASPRPARPSPRAGRGGPGAADLTAPPGRGRDRPGEGARGGARSPRSSSPSLNWPLSLIRSCRSSSDCGGSRAGELSGPGPGAAAKGARPRGGGGTAGPGALRRSLPAAGSMARGGGSRRRRRVRSARRGGSERAEGRTDHAEREGGRRGVEVRRL